MPQDGFYHSLRALLHSSQMQVRKADKPACLHIRLYMYIIHIHYINLRKKYIL